MNTFWYTFKIWQTSVIMPPLCFAFLGIVINSSIEFFPGMLLTWAVVGTIFSFPSFLLFWLATHFIMRTGFTPAHQKLLLSVTGFLFTALPFIFLGSSFSENDSLLLFALPYACLIVIGIYCYKPHTDTDSNY